MSDLVPILEEFLTTVELAAELRRNKRTLDRWDALDMGPPRTRVGRTVLYRRASVQKWLDAQERRVDLSNLRSGACRRTTVKSTSSEGSSNG